MEENRRRFTRVATENSATLIVNEKDYPVAIEDISLNGVLVDCDRKSEIVIGQDVKLFWFLSEDFPALLIRGVARWLKNQFIGIEFSDLPEETVEQLHRFLELKLADKDSFDRELEQLLQDHQ